MADGSHVECIPMIGVIGKQVVRIRQGFIKFPGSDFLLNCLYRVRH